MRDRQRVGWRELCQTRNRAHPLERRLRTSNSDIQSLFAMQKRHCKISWQMVVHVSIPGRCPKLYLNGTRKVHHCREVRRCTFSLDVPISGSLQLDGCGISVLQCRSQTATEATRLKDRLDTKGEFCLGAMPTSRNHTLNPMSCFGPLDFATRSCADRANNKWRLWSHVRSRALSNNNKIIGLIQLPMKEASPLVYRPCQKY